MTASWNRDLRQLGRAVRRARFFGAFADACLVLGLLGAIVVLGLRLGDIAVRSSPFGSPLVLLIPIGAALAWGARAMRKPLPAGLPAWLDREGGHRGLLLSALATGDAAAWKERLGPTARPRLRWRRLVVRAAPPLALLALLLWLPDGVGPREGGLRAKALADLARELDVAIEAKELDPVTEERLRERLQELERRDEQPAWSEVDALAERLAVERELSAPRRSSARQALESAAEGATPLVEALREAARAGLLQQASPDELRQLGVDPATGNIGSRNGEARLSAEQGAKLAKAVAEAVCKGDSGHGGKGDGPGAGRKKGSGRDAGKGDGKPSARSEAGSSGTPGSGGIDRGRGDAALRFLNETKGDPNRFRGTRLPDHRPAPGESERIDMRGEAPDVDPVPDRGKGGAGAAATGKATGRRVIRPRHRGVVRRYHDAR